jgi:demethylmenaquinone methyltransferase / 2-methoxy-6-polyprenyl-1,4-benzoquinol methylase
VQVEKRIAPKRKPGTPRLEDHIPQASREYLPVTAATDEQRVHIVKDIFATVTSKYDFLNHFLSFRRDVYWRRFTVDKMRFFQTRRLLDIATGTADLAIDAHHRYPDVSIVGVDFAKEMLDYGKKKLVKKRLERHIDFMQADALRLPFDDSAFDVAAIAFGIRNIPDKNKALTEMVRVVVPGGQVMVLEMGFTKNWFSVLLYRTYLNHVLPLIARVFSLNPEAYRYLADSIMNFPSSAEFVKIMEQAGLSVVKAFKLTKGITYLYTGVKREEDGRR